MLYDVLNRICEYRQDTYGDIFKTSSTEANKVKKLLNDFKNKIEEQLSEELFLNKISIEISKGAGNFPVVWHVCLLPENQKVSNGIYVAICFDKEGKGAVVGCAESKTNPKGLDTVIRKSKYTKFSGLNVDGKGDGTKYNNVFYNPMSFYYKVKPTKEDEESLLNHLVVSINDAISILSSYNNGCKIKQKTSIRTAVNTHLTSDTNHHESLPEYVTRSILYRRGQRKFRQSLLYAYEGKCAVTGCSIQELLEAAHINPFSKSGSQGDIVNNGILLRADIHTLFDLGLLKINSNYEVEISDDLNIDPVYSVLHGSIINLPKDKSDRPSIEELRKKYMGKI
ncbi:MULTISPECIES: HNH endonuclease [Providencia]|nr:MULTISPECIES: HNH endonuclease signature motif containing protein [Providencia]MCR4078626.1 HNH endonuclease [Providencia stuartii]UQZ13664.1 HNH endonuclease [Providencia stuartii]